MVDKLHVLPLLFAVHLSRLHSAQEKEREREREIEIVTFTLFSDHHFFFFAHFTTSRRCLVRHCAQSRHLGSNRLLNSSSTLSIRADRFSA